MNQFLIKQETEADLFRKEEIYAILEEICQDLELTPSQFEAARKSYEEVGAWLSASANPLLNWIEVYAHGSIGLGTTVKPIGRKDFDADVICLVTNFRSSESPAELKRMVGDRLRENEKYARMLEEKKRCWRLNYEKAFHLDISPTIPNRHCTNGGELVPDKKLREFKPTNPKGFKIWFDEKSKLQARFKIRKALSTESQANVEPFPSQKAIKGVLRRTVQLLKRHRDIHFENVKEDIAPISIIITTLASKSYEFCIGQFVFDSPLDLLIAVVRMMPHFIERPFIGGKKIYVVPNDTTQGENFADRWNSEPERAQAFYSWHDKVLSDFEKLSTLQGIDLMSTSMSKSLGESVVKRVMSARTASVSQARSVGKLFVAPIIGLSTKSAFGATPVPKNTHFGDNG
jgi:Second Messenger Oligonucleotide or Dinucleotide Synthetase domain